MDFEVGTRETISVPAKKQTRPTTAKWDALAEALKNGPDDVVVVINKASGEYSGSGVHNIYSCLGSRGLKVSLRSQGDKVYITKKAVS